MEISSDNQLSGRGTEAEDGEALDPRVQVELEKLNRASEDINKLELALDEARAHFRQVLTESTQRLNTLAKKLGNCIEKARPYYEARMKAKEAQIETQNAALRFERACSQQAAAKEMVYLAEQGFFKKGQPFDPAWQEMLNHATIKVNDAERERLESEVDHQRTARSFNECEQTVKELQKQLKRSIAKSRPYFEMKAKFNQQMEDQKNHVRNLEKLVVESKQSYAEALRNLEQISDEIHQQRQEAKLRKEMGTRSSGVGAETPDPPPYADSQDLGNIMMAHARAEHVAATEDVLESDSQRVRLEEEFRVLPNMRRSTSAEAVKHPRPTSIGGNMPASIADLPTSQSLPEGHKMVAEFKALPNTRPVSSMEESAGIVIIQEREEGATGERRSSGVSETVSDSLPTMELLTPCSDVSSIQGPITSPDTENEADSENTRMNAEIMEALQKAKNLKCPFLRPNRSRDDLFEEGGSDTESMTGSVASMSVMDDDQIENLMMEMGNYVNFLEKHAGGEVGKSTNTLPRKLSYLQDYVKFNAEWIDEENQRRASLVKSSIERDKELSPLHSPQYKADSQKSSPEKQEDLVLAKSKVVDVEMTK